MIMEKIIKLFKRILGYEEPVIVEQPEVACELQERDTELCSAQSDPKPVKKRKRGRPRKKAKKEGV